MAIIDWEGMGRQAAGIIGVDPVALVRSGVDAVLDALGVNACSSTNKQRYRALIQQTLKQAGAEGIVMGWLRAGRVASATGNCNKYALGYLARLCLQAGEAARQTAQQATMPTRDTAPERQAQHRRFLTGEQWRYLTQNERRIIVNGWKSRDAADGLHAVWSAAFVAEVERAVYQSTLPSPNDGGAGGGGGSGAALPAALGLLWFLRR